jgi:hypothetical protein
MNKKIKWTRKERKKKTLLIVLGIQPRLILVVSQIRENNKYFQIIKILLQINFLKSIICISGDPN